MLPFIVGQVATEAGTGLFSKIARTPEPKRGGMFVVSNEQIAAVGTESRCADITHIEQLRQASAGQGIPDGQLAMSKNLRLDRPLLLSRLSRFAPMNAKTARP